MSYSSDSRIQGDEEFSIFERLRFILRGISPILAAAGAIAVVGGGILFFWAEDLRTFARPVMGAGVVLLLLAGIASLEVVVATLKGRRGRYSANTLAMITFLTVVLLLGNFILFEQEFRYDTTATKQYTLSSQTEEVLAVLNQPVEAIAFFVPTGRFQESLRRQTDDLLYEFGRRSENFTYRFVDPESDPSTARQMGVTEFSTIVFHALETGSQHTVFTPPVTEQDFTSALLIVTGEEQKQVYFLTGHGERNVLDSVSDEGFGFVARGIGADNYRVQPLSIIESGEIPDDAAVLVIAGPSGGFLSRPVDEREVLTEYLVKGGNVLFLIDSDVPSQWRDLLVEWGVVIVPGLFPEAEILDAIKDPLERALAVVKSAPGNVVDVGSSLTNDPRTPILQRSQYITSENVAPTNFPRENPVTITRDLDVTFYPSAVALIPVAEEMPASLRVTDLALTTLHSWVTPDPIDNTFDPDRDTLGPHGLALAVEAIAPLTIDGISELVGSEGDVTRLMIFGDVDFATNEFFYAYSNSDFLLNAVNWLAGDYNLISIRPKPIVFRELITTRQEFDFIRYSSLFLVPAAILFLGAVVWWRRH